MLYVYKNIRQRIGILEVRNQWILQGRVKGFDNNSAKKLFSGIKKRDIKSNKMKGLSWQVKTRNTLFSYIYNKIYIYEISLYSLNTCVAYLATSRSK